VRSKRIIVVSIACTVIVVVLALLWPERATDDGKVTVVFVGYTNTTIGTNLAVLQFSNASSVHLELIDDYTVEERGGAPRFRRP
jgi:hypothetical protein